MIPRKSFTAARKKALESIWATKTEKEAERELFVSFMLSCEMCFETTQREKEKRRQVPFAERTFVAPQLRQEKKPDIVSDIWLNRPSLHLRYTHEFLHYGVIQSFIVRTQSLAEMREIWKYGLSLKEGEEKLALVEAKEKEITVQVTKNAKELLDKIRKYPVTQGLWTAVMQEEPHLAFPPKLRDGLWNCPNKCP